ncbi:HAMP domain-containing protein [Rhizobium lentis]|uniref:HAMP domain-containing protein n=1 Tax=Rhizobium lentis TaxID=1138194 RepID=UPI002180CFD5|nr:HAMP domain-containing protein [Rhizobium lentis]
MATKAEEEADASAALVLYVNRYRSADHYHVDRRRCFGARVIAKPIGEITASMSGLAEGNLDAAIPFANRRDEIGRMARAV